MSEHYCKDCKNGSGNTCTYTEAVHTTGIECPSFGPKQEESEMFKVGDKVRVVANQEKLNELCIPYKHELTGVEGVVTGIDRGESHPSIHVDFGDIYDGAWWLDIADLELVEGPTKARHTARTSDSGATKDTNPKDALGVKKAPASTLPTGPMYEVALAMLEGARKYGRHNYRTLGVKASVYYDAALRHLTAWWEGEDIDEASGIHHLMKAAACLFVVRDSMLMENWIDDRPPQYPEKLNMGRLNGAAQDMIKKYPDCIKPFCHKVDHTAPTEGGY